MRFASVYQGWETLEDFEAAINVLRVGRDEREANKVQPAQDSNN
jgi:transcriptional regulator NrdR family protein